jgi:hypothetical protein
MISKVLSRSVPEQRSTIQLRQHFFTHFRHRGEVSQYLHMKDNGRRGIIEGMFRGIIEGMFHPRSKLRLGVLLGPQTIVFFNVSLHKKGSKHTPFELSVLIRFRGIHDMRRDKQRNSMAQRMAGNSQGIPSMDRATEGRLACLRKMIGVPGPCPGSTARGIR